MSSLRDRDPFDVRLAREAPGILRAFNDAGVITSADVQVARRLATFGGTDEPSVLLAMALAVRGPRLGHVLVDLATIRETVATDTEEPVDLDALPWPEPVSWCAQVRACPLVGSADDDRRPLRLEGSALYLDRYWAEEVQVADDLRARAAAAIDDVDEAVLEAGLQRLCGKPEDERRRAAIASAVRHRLAVIAGGPGTGKTSAVAAIVELLVEQAESVGTRPPLIALAAPTGKAAARLTQSVHAQAGRPDLSPTARAALIGLTASTVHRLLGRLPATRTRFRHDRANRLPHDVVIIDEASMLSLTLMARLLEAVAPRARLVLVGDPGQLSSIEAGAVLGDIVGPAAGGTTEIADGAFGEGIVVLDRVHRHDAAIAGVAAAIRDGDPDAVLEALAIGADDVTWIEADIEADGFEEALAPVRDEAVRSGRAMIAAARTGNARDALAALGEFRLLCGHRRGPYGVSHWTPRIEEWLAADIADAGDQGSGYPGRPLLITANDNDLELFNGDTGVVIAADRGGLTAAFERRGEIFEVRPSRLGAVETVYAMTVHKSQGSQFGAVAVIVPPDSSRILTRELLYTAVTRASKRLIVVATEEAIRAAVAIPAVRATGLRTRLWGGP